MTFYAKRHECPDFNRQALRNYRKHSRWANSSVWTVLQWKHFYMMKFSVRMAKKWYIRAHEISSEINDILRTDFLRFRTHKFNATKLLALSTDLIFSFTKLRRFSRSHRFHISSQHLHQKTNWIWIERKIVYPTDQTNIQNAIIMLI